MHVNGYSCSHTQTRNKLSLSLLRNFLFWRWLHVALVISLLSVCKREIVSHSARVLGHNQQGATNAAIANAAGSCSTKHDACSNFTLLHVRRRRGSIGARSCSARQQFLFGWLGLGLGNCSRHLFLINPTPCTHFQLIYPCNALTTLSTNIYRVCKRSSCGKLVGKQPRTLERCGIGRSRSNQR